MEIATSTGKARDQHSIDNCTSLSELDESGQPKNLSPTNDEIDQRCSNSSVKDHVTA